MRPSEFRSPRPRLIAAILCVLLGGLGTTAALAGDRYTEASLALFELHRQNGRVAQAQIVLERLDHTLAPGAAERTQLAAAYERLEQRPSALRVWEALVQHGGSLSTDQRMQVAHLQESLGRRAAALRTWQAVWGERLPTAQRSIVADRILTLAAEQGSLVDLAGELEARHRAGKAGRNDTTLLVNLYVKARQARSAVESINEFFPRGGADEVQTLKEQAKVDRLLDDSEGFTRVTRRLVEIDPANRREYLRGLVLDQLSHQGPERIHEIHRLLGQLRASEGAGFEGDFEAGVLALAGFPAEAIEAYRRAIVLKPQSPDNYLLLGDALKKQRRDEEALAQFQHLTQSAETRILLTAGVDGLLNTLAGNDSAPPEKRGRAVFKWTQRLLLERLIAEGDRLYRYPLLADLFEESGDMLRSFVALETSLPLADGLRSSSLRELITLATPSDATAGVSQRSTGSLLKDSAERRVEYDRRLLALGEVLPPEVYLSAGKGFIGRGDTVSAARAFESALEANGRGDLRGEIAKLYDKAGFYELALAQYRLALVRDSDDVPVMVRLARLQERMLHPDEANDLYVRALSTILMRQPQQVQLIAPPVVLELAAPGLDPDSAIGGQTTYEFKDYYEVILQGTLRTWPREPARARAVLSALEGFFDTELSEVRPLRVARLKSLLRLDRIGSAIRYLALGTGEVDVAERIDAKQLKDFTSESGSPPRSAWEWAMWGYPQPDSGKASPAARLPTFDAALADAERTHLFDQILNLSLMNGDQNQMLMAARSWARAGFYPNAIEWADHGRLDERNFNNLCRYVAQIVRESGRRTWLYIPVAQPGLLARIEKGAGQPLFSSAQLIEQLTPKSDAFDQSVYSIPAEAYPWIASHLTPEHRLALLRMLAEKSAEVPPEDGLWVVFTYWRELIKMPLEPQFASQGADMVLAAIERNRTTASIPNAITAQLIEPQMHPANIEVAAKLISSWNERAARPIDYFRCLALLRSGQLEPSLDEYLRLLRRVAQVVDSGADLAADSVSAPLEPLRRAFLPEYRLALTQRLDSLEVQHGLDPQLAQLRFRALYMGWRSDPADASRLNSAEVDAFLARALLVSPDDEFFLAQRQSLYQMDRVVFRATAVLDRLHRLDPNESIYRGALFASYLAADRPVDAAKLNDSSPEDMRSGAFVYGLSVRRGMLDSNSPAVLLQIPPVSRPGQSGPVQFNTCARLATALAGGHTEAARGELRRLWLSVTALDETPSFWNPASFESYERILTCPLPDARDGSPRAVARSGIDLIAVLRGAAPLAGRTTFEELTRYPFSATELEDYLRSTPVADEPQIYPLYGYLAAAYVQHGLTAEKLATLNGAIAEKRANSRDVTLWLSVLASERVKPGAAALETLARLYVRRDTISLQQLMLIARVYAMGGELERAVDVYRLLAVRSLGETQDFKQVNFNGVQPEPLTAVTLLAESGRYLDPAHQREFTQDILRMVTPAPNAALQIKDAYELLSAQVGSGAAMGEPQLAWPSANLIAVANQALEAATLDEAVRDLRLLASKNSFAELLSAWPDKAAMSQVDSTSMRRYIAMLGVSPPYEPDISLMNFARKGSAPALRRAATALDEWREDLDIDPDRRLLLLAVVAYRLHALKDDAGAAVPLRNISVSLATPGRYSRQTTDFMLDVARIMDRRLELSAEQSLLAAGRLETTEVADVIERTAREEGVARGLALGEEAAAATQDDHLLTLLARLARESGDGSRAQRWQLARQSAAQARQELGMQ